MINEKAKQGRLKSNYLSCLTIETSRLTQVKPMLFPIQTSRIGQYPFGFRWQKMEGMSLIIKIVETHPTNWWYANRSH